MHKAVVSALAGAAVLAGTAVGSTPAGAAYPGRNGYVVYTVQYESRFTILRRHPDGTGRAKLTTDGTSSNPVVSPDGRRIAYLGAGTLSVMNADGSAQRDLGIRVAGSRQDRQSFSWSPDGSKLAVVTPGGLKLFTARGGYVRTLLLSGYTRASYNPRDQDRILVGPRRILHVASGRFTDVRIRPVAGRDAVSSITWMPEGRSVAFLSPCDATGSCTQARNVFVAPVSGGPRQQRTHRTAAGHCDPSAGCSKLDDVVAAPDGSDFLVRENYNDGAGVTCVHAVHARVSDCDNPFAGYIYLGDWQSLH